MERWIGSLLCFVLLVGLLSGCSCDHDWEDATCDDPVTCSKCGEEAGDKLGHDWQAADCETPKTCRRCDKTRGDALGHTVSENSNLCQVCGKEVQPQDRPEDKPEPMPSVGYALRIEGYEVSCQELNYFYIDAINDFYSGFGSYGDSTDDYIAQLFGLDTGKPLSEQIRDKELGTTWADYFLDQAVSNARWTYAMYARAVQDNFTLSEQDQLELERVGEYIDLYATYSGYSSADPYLQAVYGEDAGREGFLSYSTICYTANRYVRAYMDDLEFSQSEIREYDALHGVDYNSYSFAIYSIRVTEDPDQAQADVQQLLGCSGTLDHMNEIISCLSCYDGTTAQIYSDYSGSEMNLLNNDLRNWIVSADRYPGEMGVIDHSTQQGGCYYAVLYLGRQDNRIYPANVRHLLILHDGNPEQAKKQAVALMDRYLEGACTEESFTQLLRQYTQDVDNEGKPNNDGLYTDIVANGRFVQAFEDWATDEHVPGDVGIIETEYGYHLMYFVGNSNDTYRDLLITEDMKNEACQRWMEEIADQANVERGDLSAVNEDYVIHKR